MTIEERIKQQIINEYGSVRAFTVRHNLTYASIDSILRRGIKNATWNNVNKLCAALGISADELAQNRIIKTVNQNTQNVKVEDMVQEFNQKVMTAENLTIDGVPISQEDIRLIADTLDTAVEVRKKHLQAYKDKLT